MPRKTESLIHRQSSKIQRVQIGDLMEIMKHAVQIGTPDFKRYLDFAERNGGSAHQLQFDPESLLAYKYR
jgi:hypothetical protein